MNCGCSSESWPGPARGRPPAEFLDVVALDEFTNDVVVRVTPEAFAVSTPPDWAR